jgi:hypothetical protein
MSTTASRMGNTNNRANCIGLGNGVGIVNSSNCNVKDGENAADLG